MPRFSVWGRQTRRTAGLRRRRRRSVYIQLRTNMLPLMDIFCQYSKNNTGLKPHVGFVDRLLSANLVTGAMGSLTIKVFEHAAVTSKLNQLYSASLSSFMLVHIAYLCRIRSALSVQLVRRRQSPRLAQVIWCTVAARLRRFMEPPLAYHQSSFRPERRAKNAGPAPVAPSLPCLQPQLGSKSPMAKGVIAGAGGQESRRERAGGSFQVERQVASTAAASGAPLRLVVGARLLEARLPHAGSRQRRVKRDRGYGDQSEPGTAAGPPPRSSSPTPAGHHRDSGCPSLCKHARAR